jgi:glycosyltransferase involved in cell wall biosynthesis
LLVTVHDVFHLAMTQYVSGIAKKIYSKLMFKALMYKADKILSVSQFTKDELLKYVGGNEEKIIVTHNGVNKKWFKDKNQDAIFNKPYILYVGNVKPHKNLSNLIRAFSKIENKIDHSLVIVGKKDGFITNDNDVQKLTEQHKDRIIFTGFVEDADLINYVQHTSLFVFPSLYEGFGLPPLEAMASGVPIAVSNIPPLREVCGKVACYFNPLDETDMAIKIYNALMTKVTAEEKERSIQQAKRYIWEDCALKTEKVIKELLK